MKKRFKEKLEQQIRFISKSSRAFDAGDEEEAVRIAVAMRIIFYDTQRSTSLMKHLRLKGTKMLGSSRGHGDYRDFLGQKIDLTSPNPVTMIPLLEDRFVEMPMREWWKQQAVFVHEGKDFTRKDIVCSIAHKDGGAHVDERLEKYYEVLCEGKYALGITGDLEYEGDPPFEQGVLQHPTNAHLALTRQFAHEVIASFTHYRWAQEKS